ncbi:MAG: NUDIX hydrolase [Tepidisphaeraceae bacterium]
MAIPDYVRELRKKVGTDLLLLPAAGAVVMNDAGQVLLQKRSDTLTWHTLGGLMEPGESPAEAVVREVLEEAGVVVVPLYVTGIYTGRTVVYANGDHVESVITCFACRYISGDPHPADDESVDVRWFDPGALPDLRSDIRQRIEYALSGRREAWFAPTTRTR